jgi:hypothetical protein
MTTPSGWHDDAMGRDTGHDEMQIAVWEWLCRNSRGDVTLEWPVFRSRGSPRIVAFADIAEVFRQPAIANRAGSRSARKVVTLFEIKPRVISVGGLLRQCVALVQAVAACHTDQRTQLVVRAFPVVPASEPKLDLLRQVFDDRLLVWDGERLIGERREEPPPIREAAE